MENVYPKIDDLNVEPCRKVIQDAFEDHIIHAPGMENVRDMVNGPIIPTPGAVMECTKLLYDCLGDLIVLDVGGATTDLHSVATESDNVARIMIAPEPKAKRTVEGDLGVYVNRMKVIESIGDEKFQKKCEKAGIDPEKTLETYKAIPKNEDEIKLVEILTEEAVMKAVERHAGTIRYVYGPSGRTTLAEGKDLTQVKYIVGTGGALTRLPHREDIMKRIAAYDETGMRLFPTSHAEILVDNDYIMASLGVLSVKHREGAIRLLEKSLGFTFPEKALSLEQKLAADAKAQSAGMQAEDGTSDRIVDGASGADSGVGAADAIPAALRGVADELAEKDAKRKELIKHIEESEALGYDMTAYREDLGLPIPEKTPGEGLVESEPGLTTSAAQAGNPHVMRTCGEVDGRMPNCDRNCKLCYRKHCKYRQV